MIPPVEHRQTRLCVVCYHCLFDSCMCRLDKSGKKNVRQYYSRVDPCANNITLEEIQELINQHNQGNTRVFPKWLREKIEEFYLCPETYEADAFNGMLDEILSLTPGDKE